jgi:hypothetical protein
MLVIGSCSLGKHIQVLLALYHVDYLDTCETQETRIHTRPDVEE